MKWYDKPRRWWGYQWLHHFWVLSFNRNKDLYRVVWWSKYTRPVVYNSQGRVRPGAYASGYFLPIFFTVAFIVWLVRY